MELSGINGSCAGQSVNAAITQPDRNAHLVCVESTLSPGTASPQTFDGTYPPQLTITTNTPMDFTYGPPDVTIASSTGAVYYDQTPDYYDTSTLIVYSGNIPPLNDDVYYVIVSVHLPDGSLGSTAVSTISTYGNPYDNSGGGSSCNPKDDPTCVW